jgi:hypothetical protein
MKTKKFINKLNENRDKPLLIEFAKNKYADTNYHLTEVKNVQFSTVDCGGNTNKWQETHLQIWESPSEKGKEEYLTVAKVLAILNRVDSINPLIQETEIKVEFGNEEFHTSVMKISGFTIKDNQLIVQLFTEKTLCKAPDVCGDEQGSCCETEEVKEDTTSCCEGTSCC